MKNQFQIASEAKFSRSTSTLAHETRKTPIKMVSVLSTVAVIAIFAGMLIGCQIEQEHEPLDAAIVNSSELEEYIVAGTDLQRSLAIFEKELNKIDFSALEITYREDGRKVVHLPSASAGSNIIAGKVQTFNEKRESLLKKFPQIAFFREETGKRYFEHAIQNSVNVQGEFLKMGINTSRPKLKSGNESIYMDFGDDQCQLLNFLHNWATNPYYVEVIILGFSDGTWGVYIDGENDETNAFIEMTEMRQNGQIIGYKYNGKVVTDFGHTHGAGPNGPNPSCGDDPKQGVHNFIYYDYSFNYYNQSHYNHYCP